MKNLEKDLEKLFKALANKRRIAIIRFLSKRKEATVGEIARHIKLSFKSTSRHLAVFYVAELVNREQRSLQMFYSLPPKPHALIKYISNSHE